MTHCPIVLRGLGGSQLGPDDASRRQFLGYNFFVSQHHSTIVLGGLRGLLIHPNDASRRQFLGHISSSATHCPGINLLQMRAAPVFAPFRWNNPRSINPFVPTVPTCAVRETASLGIMEAPRVPPLNPSESIVLSEHYRL